VRFSNLEVSADVNIGSRGMPTVANAFVNKPLELLTSAGLLKSHKHHLTILKGVTGVLKPGRLTLLLGPPSSGKSTLLKALAGLLRDKHNTDGLLVGVVGVVPQYCWFCWRCKFGWHVRHTCCQQELSHCSASCLMCAIVCANCRCTCCGPWAVGMGRGGS
jgi:translation initiation factor RLI1